jgi:hypothetical protein
MHEVPVIHVMDAVGPLLAAAAFVAVMSLVREPVRHNLNAVLVAGSILAYVSGGFGVWELAYPAIATPVAYLALRSYRFVGIGWLMHAGWDVLHHLFGNPLWPFMPTSSFGCIVFDSAIAVWFLAGAPTIVRLPRLRQAVPTDARPSSS